MSMFENTHDKLRKAISSLKGGDKDKALYYFTMFNVDLSKMSRPGVVKLSLSEEFTGLSSEIMTDFSNFEITVKANVIIAKLTLLEQMFSIVHDRFKELNKQTA